MGGKTGTTTNQTTIPPEVLARYNSVNAQAQTAAATPFHQYSTNPNSFVAPLNSQQNAGISNINEAAGAAQPYYQAATGLTAAGAGAANPGALNINQYMSPYLGDVVGNTAALLGQQNATAMSGQTGSAIQNGAFGGDRAGVAAANLSQQQNLATGNVISGLLNQGYNTALGTAQQQQGINLSADQANLARLSQAGQSMAGLGTGLQQTGLAGGSAQLQAGTLGQQTSQQGLSALYNQFLQQQGYPFQVSQFLANIAEGTGALSGNTTTSTGPMPFFSDRRLKESIQKIGATKDGLSIYRFKYKNDPNEQFHIGFMADEVEKKHPEAVGLHNGFKTVDYDAATRVSHKDGGVVGKFAYGGAPSQSDLMMMMMMAGQNGGGQGNQNAGLGAMQKVNMGPYGMGEFSPGNFSYVPSGNSPIMHLNAAQGTAPKTEAGMGQVQQALQFGNSLKGLWNDGKQVASSLGNAISGPPPSASIPPDALSQNAFNANPESSGVYADGGSVNRGGFSLGGLPYETNSNDPNSNTNGIIPDSVLQQGQQNLSLPRPGQSNQQNGQGSGLGSAIGAVGNAAHLATQIPGMMSALTGTAAAGTAAAGTAAAGTAAAGTAAAGGLGAIGSGLSSIAGAAANFLPLLALLSTGGTAGKRKNFDSGGAAAPDPADFSYARDPLTMWVSPDQTNSGQGQASDGSSPIPLPPEQPARLGASSVPLPPEQPVGLGASSVPLPPERPAGLGASSISNQPLDLHPSHLPPLLSSDGNAQAGSSSFDPFIAYQSAVKGIESAGSGGYSALGPVQKNGDQALGAYGIMASNLPSWSEKFLGKQISQKEFLSNPAAQDKIFNGQFGSYVDKYGNPQEAASMWFSGRPIAQAGNSADSLGTTVPSYIDKFNKGLAAAGSGLMGVVQGAGHAIGNAAQGVGSGLMGAAQGFGSELGNAAQGAGNFISNATKGAANALGSNEQFWVPLLTGLGTMASSPSRYLGSAILQGLGGGAQAYANLQNQQAEVGQTDASTLNSTMDAIHKSIFPVNGVYYAALANGSLQNYQDWLKNPNGPLMGGANASNAAKVFNSNLSGRMPPSSAPVAPQAPNAPLIPGVAPQGASAPSPVPTANSTISPATLTNQFAGPKSASPTATGMPVASSQDNNWPSNIPADSTLNAAIAGEDQYIGPNIAQLRDQSTALINNATNGAQAARQSYNSMTSLINAISSSNSDPNMINRAGSLPAERSELTNALNTFSRGITGQDLFSLSANNQIIEKSSALLALSQTSGAHQNSYAALEGLQNILPSLGHDPKANGVIIATLRQAQQREIDQSNFFNAYGAKTANNSGTIINAPDQFNRIYQPIYQKEHTELESLYNSNNPKVTNLLKYVSSGVSPAQAQTALKNAFGNSVSPTLYRYFTPGAQ